jgi:hypothetical protein
MTQQPTHLPTQTGPVPDRLPIFGPPALLAGEDSAAYDNLLARVSGNLKRSWNWRVASPKRSLTCSGFVRRDSAF